MPSTARPPLEAGLGVEEGGLSDAAGDGVEEARGDALALALAEAEALGLL